MFGTNTYAQILLMICQFGITVLAVTRCYPLEQVFLEHIIDLDGFTQQKQKNFHPDNHNYRTHF